MLKFVQGYCGTLTCLCSGCCYIIIEKVSAVFILLRNIRVGQTNGLLEKKSVSVYEGGIYRNFPEYQENTWKSLGILP